MRFWLICEENWHEFHPSKIPISKIFNVKDEKQATEAAHEMVMIGFDKEDKGYKVLMSKKMKKLQNGLDIQWPQR